jgi:hypothetical protein
MPLRRSKRKPRGIEIEWTHQLLAYVHDIDLFSGNIRRPTMKKNAEALLSRGTVGRLRINAQETIHVSYQNVRQNYNTNII